MKTKIGLLNLKVISNENSCLKGPNFLRKVENFAFKLSNN